MSHSRFSASVGAARSALSSAHALTTVDANESTAFSSCSVSARSFRFFSGSDTDAASDENSAALGLYSGGEA